MGSKFIPISVSGKSFGNPYVSRQRNPFNDSRLYKIWQKLGQRLVERCKVSIQQLAKDNKEAMQFYRFLGNARVSIEELIKMNCTVEPENLKGREILMLGDTSTVNMKKRLGRIKDVEKLGVLQDGKTPGFFMHVNLALDATDSSIIGLGDILFWNRNAEQNNKKTIATTLPDTEFSKWQLGVDNASQVVDGAQRVTYVFDREADSFDLMSHIVNELEQDFTIRSRHNRTVIWNGKQMLVDECLEQSQVLGSYEIELPALDHYSWTMGKRIHRKARKARLELRAEAVEVLPPKDSKSKETLYLYIVEAREVSTDLPPEEAPLCWRLWTTHEADTFEKAKTVVGYYLNRWTIEQLFRTMKKKGFNQEATELESVDGVLRQTAMVIKAATTVMQLVNARDQHDGQPVGDAFNEQEQEVLQKINEHVQGNTDKQKNPYPANKLSWAAWVIARLGGWKGYLSQKPPGPITMKRGLDKFYMVFEARLIFNSG